MELRTYQKQIITQIRNKIKQNQKNILCTTTMGSGKTVIISFLIKELEKELKIDENIVILLNIKELIINFKEHFEELSIYFNIIAGNQIKIDPKNKIYLIMEQSFHKNKRLEYETLLKGKTKYLIKDEYHIGYEGDRYKNIKFFLNNKYLIGFSGTPYSSTGDLIPNFHQENIITIGDAKFLTEKNFLVPLKYYIPKWSILKNYDNVKKVNGEYTQKSIENYINNSEHNELVIKSIEELNGKKKKILVYCNSIKHANIINELLKRNGYKSVVIHGKVSEKNIINHLEKYDLDIKNKNSINCLVSVSKLTTGFNKPNAELLVLLRPTNILRLYLQIIFRVARINNNKKTGIILDLAQCVQKHGFGIETRKFIKSKKDRSLEKIKENKRKKALKSLTSTLEEPLEISEEQIQMKLKELRIKSLDINQMNTRQIITYFENNMDIEILIELLFELDKRINKKNYNINEVYYYVEELKKIPQIENTNYLINIKNEIKEEIRNKKSLKIKITQIINESNKNNK